MYVKDAAAVILVYDMTYADSLDGVKTWFSMVSEHLNMAKTVVALVGNKCDCNDEIQVSPQQARHLQQEIQAQICLEISAKQNLNIAELLNKIAELLMEQEDLRDRT
jgi:tRNA U34 5-carboxymethylaminomethyl modifying GTPase MnmE/TrmE